MPVPAACRREDLLELSGRIDFNKEKSMRKTSVATLVSALLLATNASALDLLQAYKDAQAYDSQFSSARLQRDATRERLAQGRAGLLPQVGLTATVNRIDGDATLQQGTFPIGYTADSYQLQLKQPLYNLGNLTAYDQSKLQVTAGETQFEQARIDLTLRVAQAYFDVLAALDTIGFIQAQKTAISEQLASAKRNFQVGTATITDTHEAQARYDLALAQEIAAQNDLAVKRHALAQIIGKEAGELSGLRAGVKIAAPEPAAMDSWVKQAEAGNLGVVTQGISAEIAKLDVQRARAGHHPTLDAIASHGRQKSFFTGPVTTTTTAIGVQLTVPIFSGFATSSQVTQALALEDKSRADLDTARRNAAQGARSAFLGVQSGLSQVRALEAAEASSKLALDANNLGYSVGVRINIDVLNAQQQLYSTRRDLAKARYDTLLAGLKLKAAAGTLAETDLAELNALLDAR